jgi:HEAT repeat protein
MLGNHPECLFMKLISLAIVMGGWAWICFAGCQATYEAPAQKGPARAKVADGKFIEVRYRLPNQQALAGKSSAARWGLAAPVEAGQADPNRIVYDQEYIEKYVDWAAAGSIACGPATYVIVTPQGERSVQSGHDELYLGQRFSAEAFLTFLKTRAAGMSVERTFRVNHAEAVKLLRENPESSIARQLQESPWDRDTRMVVGLLGLIPYEPAYPLIVSLAKDPNRDVQDAAILALGRLAGRVPAAVDELEKLLGEESARSAAASALVMAGEAALPAITRSLDHPDWIVRNLMVHSLGSHADAAIATPVLRRVLLHSDAEVREWGVGVIVDRIARGGPEQGQPFAEALSARLVEDTSANTRRSAALALLNMKLFAAPAESALRQAAEKEKDSQARRFASEALQALESELKASRQGALGTIATEKDAIRHFHAAREAAGLARAPDERPSVRRDLLRDCLARIKGTLRPNEEKDAIKYGELSALDLEGECWVVEVDQGLLGAQFAYFDDMGNLLLAWRAPEG